MAAFLVKIKKWNCQIMRGSTQKGNDRHCDGMYILLSQGDYSRICILGHLGTEADPWIGKTNRYKKREGANTTQRTKEELILSLTRV
jgi:hypothetical protein